ncbi:hypothetical protein [Fusobacterium polymorphum]|uniref:hypothetical protein n=1 Tax=Fusobacterium nucleatum subsp. polymorphum TaxID=76857 RepID=UPI0030D51D7F
MKVHKKIKINTEELENSIKHYDLIRRAKRWISDYNKDKDKEIVFTYTNNSGKAAEWGYLHTSDMAWLDSYFIDVLGMTAVTKASRDNKTADRYYFFEE